jgi:hypothetical protein
MLHRGVFSSGSGFLPERARAVVLIRLGPFAAGHFHPHKR